MFALLTFKISVGVSGASSASNQFIYIFFFIYLNHRGYTCRGRARKFNRLANTKCTVFDPVKWAFQAFRVYTIFDRNCPREINFIANRPRCNGVPACIFTAFVRTPRSIRLKW
ncbi:hypothetical protein EB796_002402 [Bugula neritina]|uniref:Uncharacterized protein n=1 Tax=Bugula neritina TaxID=10212 RepID=A0A7J7KM96_BUGNE|nr:hypothetical protein EB796_002402 [Bugula neritina]